MYTLASELYWLTLNVNLTSFMATPYAAYRLKKIGGITQVFKTPLPDDSPYDDDWEHRHFDISL